MTTGPALRAMETVDLLLSGTPNQIEWALQIRPRVKADFDRVSSLLSVAARKQPERDRLDTESIIAILEDKCASVMGMGEAGYFIRNWQELTDQVRRLIRDDPRYVAINLAKAERQVRSSQEAPQLLS